MRKLLLALVLLISVAYGQKVPTSAKTVINKTIYPAANVPAVQGQYYDSTNFKWSDFISTAEILSFYGSTERFGHFPIYAKIGGTRVNGVVTGGTYHAYSFKNGVADSNLVEVTTPALFDGTVSSAQNRPRKTDGSLVDSAILIASDLAALLPTKNITDSVAFFGYWFKTVKQGLPCMTTINNGTYFRGAVKGTATISIKLVGTIGNPNPPMVGYSVDGSPYTYITTSNGISTVTIATGLDTSVTHTFKVIVKSIDENYDRWTNADNGVNIAAIYIDAGATVVPLGSVASALFFGDSITNGDLIYTHTLPNPDLVAAGNGAINYVQLLGAKLNEDVFQHGMGGTGWFIPAYNVPPFRQNAFTYYANHPAGVLKNIDKVFLNIGTNSGGQTASNVVGQIDSFTVEVNAHLPTAEKIMIIPVGYKYYDSAIGNSTRAAGRRNGWTILDGSKYPDNIITYSDGNVHPDSAGSVAFANLLYADYLKQHSPPTNTSAYYLTYTDVNGTPTNTGILFNPSTGAYTFPDYSTIHFGAISVLDGALATVNAYNSNTALTNTSYISESTIANTTNSLVRGNLTVNGAATVGTSLTVGSFGIFEGDINTNTSYGFYNNAHTTFVQMIGSWRGGTEVQSILSSHHLTQWQGITTTARNALSPIEGMHIYNSTTHTLDYYNGTNWISSTGIGGSFSPIASTFNNTTSGNTTVASANYTQNGNVVTATYAVTCKPTTGATVTSFIISLPVTTTSASPNTGGFGTVYANVSTPYMAPIQVSLSTTSTAQVVFIPPNNDQSTMYFSIQYTL